MSKAIKIGAIIIALNLSTSLVYAEDLLTGDVRTACEVVLCLSSPKGKSIAECQPPLRKYYSISARKWKDTVRKRKNFLKLCPSVNNSLADNISNLKDCHSGFSFFRKRCERQNKNLQNSIDKILNNKQNNNLQIYKENPTNNLNELLKNIENTNYSNTYIF